MVLPLNRYFLPFVIVLVLVVLSSILFASPSYIPYSNGPQYASYEGFQEGGEEEEKIEEEPTVEGETNMTEKKVAKVASGPPTEGMSLSDLLNAGGNSSSKSESFVTLSPSALNGQDHLYPTAINGIQTVRPLYGTLYPSMVSSSEHIDRFLDVNTVGVDGQNGCQSSGLSNSRGALCLSDDLIRMLKTRGGNAG